MRDFGGIMKSLLRFRSIEQITFQIRNLRIFDHLGLNITGPELNRRTEIGAHAALGIGRNQNKTTAGWCAAAPVRSNRLDYMPAFGRRRRGEMYAHRMH